MAHGSSLLLMTIWLLCIFKNDSSESSEAVQNDPDAHQAPTQPLTSGQYSSDYSVTTF